MDLAGLDGALYPAAASAFLAATLLPALAAIVPGAPAVLRQRVPRVLALLGCVLVAALVYRGKAS